MITEFYNHFKMIKPDVQEMHTNLRGVALSREHITHCFAVFIEASGQLQIILRHRCYLINKSEPDKVYQTSIVLPDSTS